MRSGACSAIYARMCVSSTSNASASPRWSTNELVVARRSRTCRRRAGVSRSASARPRTARLPPRRQERARPRRARRPASPRLRRRRRMPRTRSCRTSSVTLGLRTRPIIGAAHPMSRDSRATPSIRSGHGQRPARHPAGARRGVRDGRHRQASRPRRDRARRWSDFGVAQRAAAVGGAGPAARRAGDRVALVLQPAARWGALAALLLLLAFLAGIATRAAPRRGARLPLLRSDPLGSRRARDARPQRRARAAGRCARRARGPASALDDWIDGRGGSRARRRRPRDRRGRRWGRSRCGCGARTARLQRDLTDRASSTSRRCRPGLPAGLPAPAFALPDLDGDTRTLAALCARGRNVALIFATPGLRGLPQAAAGHRPLAGEPRRSPDDRDRQHAARPTATAPHSRSMASATSCSRRGSEVMSDYRVRATPSAVLVGARRRGSAARLPRVP